MIRDVFIGELILVRGCWRRARSRDASPSHPRGRLLNRAFGPYEREDARSFGQVDERLKQRSGEPFRRDMRDGMTIELPGAPDSISSIVPFSGMTGIPAFSGNTTVSARYGSGCRASKASIPVRWYQDAHDSESARTFTRLAQTPRWRFSARNPALNTRERNCTPSSSLPGAVSNLRRPLGEGAVRVGDRPQSDRGHDILDRQRSFQDRVGDLILFRR